MPYVIGIIEEDSGPIVELLVGVWSCPAAVPGQPARLDMLTGSVLGQPAPVSIISSSAAQRSLFVNFHQAGCVLRRGTMGAHFTGTFLENLQ